ncbi:exopolysaccharide biosynthesis polyprenyl glycosylphosphotransferase [Gangjinia marincola]|uniref:Exopolysaccharide biosynthesis polyprenyl glycosylphosphotransferase n=1 Tax=Gangjinia marincola TaxID=578463 RepID=A0ABP3XUD6_9FLAO
MSKTSTYHFEISERIVLLRIFDIVFSLGTLFLVGQIFDFGYFSIRVDSWIWSIVLAIYLIIFAEIFELYNLQKASKFYKTFQNITLATSITVLFYILTPFYTPPLPENRLQIIYFFLSLLTPLALWRYAYVKFVAIQRFNKRILIVGDSFDVDDIKEQLEKADPNLTLVGYVDTNKKTAKPKDHHLIEFNVLDIRRSINEFDINEVVVTSTHDENITAELYSELIYLLENGFPIKEYTQVYEEITHRIPVQHVAKDFYRYFPFSRSNQNKLYLFFQRLFDILFAGIGVLVGSLFLPFILVGNLVGNRGPLFYSQMRVGKNGKVFYILKLRSMVTNAESGGAQWAQKNDARITVFGKLLRKSRLDELPQFLNILKGDMSLIGPRPERPVFVRELSRKIPFYETRHVINPGLTGWAQVNAKYASSEEDTLEKLQYDLYYIKHRSFFLDIRIILRTLSTVIFFRGQ